MININCGEYHNKQDKHTTVKVWELNLGQKGLLKSFART